MPAATALEQYSNRFVRELPAACKAGSYFDQKVLSWIISNRNVAEHTEGSIPLEDKDCKQLIKLLQAKLDEMFYLIRFVRNYPLGLRGCGSTMPTINATIASTPAWART